MILTQMVRWNDDTGPLKNSLRKGLKQVNRLRRAAKRLRRKVRGKKR